jgi:hypothetical protein
MLAGGVIQPTPHDLQGRGHERHDVGSAALAPPLLAPGDDPAGVLAVEALELEPWVQKLEKAGRERAAGTKKAKAKA